MNTKNTDIIIVAPIHVDFPMFRSFLHKAYNYFNKIYYVFTNTHADINYVDFIKNNLQFVTFLHIPQNYSGDWRDVSTNLALSASISENILFIEPDFQINLDVLLKLPDDVDVISYVERCRIWPSFLYVKRDLINKTNKNFAAGIFDNIYKLNCNGNNSILKFNLIHHNNFMVDHFDKFISELLMLTKNFYLLNEHNIQFKHYAGITHNYYLCESNQLKFVYEPEIFIQFLIDNLNSDVQLDPMYIKRAEKYIQCLKSGHKYEN